MTERVCNILINYVNISDCLFLHVRTHIIYCVGYVLAFYRKDDGTEFRV